MSCDHIDVDEYFEVCLDCNATFEEIEQENYRQSWQGGYHY